VELAGLLKRYNMTYRRIVSGEYKDTGTPFRELMPDEEQMLQELIDEIHIYFVEEVALNRNLSEDKVKELATGEIFTGAKSKEIGLIDEIGGFGEVTAYLENNLNTTIDYAVFEQERGLFDIFTSMTSEHGFAMGKGIGSFLNNNQPLIKT
jgi:protease-4